MAIKNDEAFRAMQTRLADLLPRLNERDRRVAMAIEAKSWGRGGISAVQRATGASRSTIRRGLDDLTDDAYEGPDHRVRALGGGRKKAEVTDPELVNALDTLIEPETRGDPESPLRWTTKSTRHLAGGAIITTNEAITLSASTDAPTHPYSAKPTSPPTPPSPGGETLRHEIASPLAPNQLRGNPR